jgi:hypothetical protein
LIDEHLPRVWHSFKVANAPGEATAPSLAAPIRSALRFYRKGTEGEFGRSVPVFVSGEQTVPAEVLTELSSLIDQPVMVLPVPARVPPYVRHSTYLACLGLLMRRN